MNIRKQVGFQGTYAEINREERNYAAILYAALLSDDNLVHFVELVEASLIHKRDDRFGLYFEYSFLRDLWNHIDGENANNLKRKLILSNLNLSIEDDVGNMSIQEFNRFFGVAGTPSNVYIQSPSGWSIRKYHPNIENHDDFLNICKFKWSFNIKPDLVIHLNQEEVICVEIKYTAGEGSYPSSSVDKKIFSERGLPRVMQTELQQYMMEELLGYRTSFVYLVYKPSERDNNTELTWTEVFECIDTASMPVFVHDMISNVLDDSVN